MNPYHRIFYLPPISAFSTGCAFPFHHHSHHPVIAIGRKNHPQQKHIEQDTNPPFRNHGKIGKCPVLVSEISQQVKDSLPQQTLPTAKSQRRGQNSPYF